jgi:Protein of unknown function (DUF3025)
MRFVAPARDAIDPALFRQPPLSHWREFGVLDSAGWPTLAALNELANISFGGAAATMPHFVAQTPALLGDGLHYEQRIAERGQIATRVHNWHDLLNALVWLRFPALKAALNARQVSEIAHVGTKQRSRAQCALTHFDEGGVIVLVRDPSLLAVWDAHDWHGLFCRRRHAWTDGSVEILVFGHALLEHALKPAQLLVGKALAVMLPQSAQVQSEKIEHEALQWMSSAIRSGQVLNDPQELRPLPLSGIPGWHVDNEKEAFYAQAPCFRPLPAGRVYPAVASRA